MNDWQKAQKWESSWWGNCCNTVWEDVKQMNLAPYLGLKVVPNKYTDMRIPLKGQSILDIGGGPSSILLKCENGGRLAVADPCKYPDWVVQRYQDCNIDHYLIKGEDIVGEFYDGVFDEVWIYNVLQHTEEPEEVIKSAQRVGKIIRIFEWLETGTNEGHLHSFTKEQLDSWLKGEGKVINLNSNGLYGKAYYGIFLGDSYDTKAEG